jgi:sulfur-carrier protein adenylyltransferase/sulfurtransferase
VGDYATTDPSKNVLVADDAEVSVMAAHATRFAIDLLIDSGGGGFPHSVYAIGLRPGWIFSQPFEAHPIAVQNTAAVEEPADEATTTAGLRFLMEVLGTDVQANPAA